MLGVAYKTSRRDLSTPTWGPATTFSLLPFLITFLAVFTFAWRTLFPLLSGQSSSTRPTTESRQRSQFGLFRVPATLRRWALSSLDRAPAITFSTTVSLSAVLAELIFCEITNSLNPAARRTALECTISILLVSLVIITPALEIHSITTAANWKFSSLKRGTRAFAWSLDVIGLILWLTAFWWIGHAVLGSRSSVSVDDESRLVKINGFSQGSLERIGIIGISLMASLAGFAAVSSLWQTFGVKTRTVTEEDIARKESGLEATNDLVAAKESRLRALELRVLDTQGKDAGFVTRMMGSIKGSDETQELAALKMEVRGLETMQLTLSNSVRLLRARRDAQQKASTPVGKIFIVISYIFSLYCLYRIAATSIATLRRWWHPTQSFASSDPINNVLALVAKHWDPSLDRAAWSRQISFLLSGLMLLASFNAVLQTVLLFSRFTPSKLLHSAQQNLALLVSQISGTYVVSSALLLRSNLPKEMGSVIESALGAPLDTAFAERWFEGWFLGACVVTTIGIWFGRSVVGMGSWEEDVEDVDVEVGKRS